jgi:tetratricopeptide (TPR) repeat protein
MRTMSALEDLFRLLPDLEELEALRLSAARIAVADPSKAWESSSSFATIDKRVIDGDRLEEALEEARADLHAFVDQLFGRLSEVLRAYWRNDDEEVAARLIATGEWLESEGQHGRAARCYETALGVAQPLQVKGPQILALRRIARVNQSRGNLEESRLLYQRSQELARNAGDLLGEVVGCTGMGNALALQGRWSEAETAYRKGLQRLGPDGTRPEMALQRGQLFNNLGMVATRLKRFDQSEEWFERALAQWRMLDAPADLAIRHHNEALLRMEQGRTSDARECFLRALELEIPCGLRAPVAIDLAECMLKLGSQREAEEWGRKAEDYAVEARSPYYLARVYRGLGNISRDTGAEDGFTFYEKALEISRAHAYRLLEAETLTEYARMRVGSSGEQEARAYLERSIEIFRELGDVGELARAESVLEGIGEVPVRAVGD